MIRVFFSYSHKDEELRNELETHLALLKRQGIISAWHDRRITAGNDFENEISKKLEDADLILLLISASFLASDYCYDKEMTRALEKHDEGNAVVIPVILHPCDWQASPFRKLRATPTDGKPISMHANVHEALSIIAKDVRKVAEGQSRSTSDTRSEIVGGKPKAPLESAQARSSNLRIKRSYDDHEKDQFLEDSYEYIAWYFDGSLMELMNRNPRIKTRLKRTSETSFMASIYDAGEKAATCSIWYGGNGFGSNDIRYSSSESWRRNSFSESLNVVEDGYSLQLKPLGMQIYASDRERSLSQEGAAEYFWGMFIRPLQD